MIILATAQDLTNSIIRLGNSLLELVYVIFKIWPIFIPIGIALFIKLRKSKKIKTSIQETNIPETKDQIDTDTPETKDQIDTDIQNEHIISWSESYQKKQLLTNNEWQQYKVLEKWCNKNKYILMLKVRLADLIEPRSNKNNTLWWKIQAKHLDFIVCDKNINPIHIIELQDNSHKKPERIERDKFVKEVLSSCGYKISFTYAITEEYLNKLFNIDPQEVQE